ncbi:MAG: hypothetical protein KKI07_00370 [Euryarchaeota archaeon]|nr:hypothetical protein [Euryarchaeota archaeon]
MEKEDREIILGKVEKGEIKMPTMGARINFSNTSTYQKLLAFGKQGLTKDLKCKSPQTTAFFIARAQVSLW